MWGLRELGIEFIPANLVMCFDARAAKSTGTPPPAAGGTVANDTLEAPGASSIFMTTDPVGAPGGLWARKENGHDE